MSTFLYCRRMNEALFPESVKFTVQNGYNTLGNLDISSSSTNCLYRDD